MFICVKMKDVLGAYVNVCLKYLHLLLFLKTVHEILRFSS